MFQSFSNRKNYPKLCINLDFIYGETETEYKRQNTAAPGQAGNYALAGYRNYAYKKLFSRLDELKAGDEISITTKKVDLTYKVTGTKVVTPDDVSVLKEVKIKA